MIIKEWQNNNIIILYVRFHIFHARHLARTPFGPSIPHKLIIMAITVLGLDECQQDKLNML